ncbi:transglutaminase N-terminal domain-containing protein [Yoonia litorea]|uniref:Transglutaminase-like N-terminal region n=1 Tax=Yoonia litorea TaxID=1123755 RepID=A0A1I6ME50_9RHOB|nr:transglutaminase-like N-terminal region [Yoonia litorea]
MPKVITKHTTRYLYGNAVALGPHGSCYAHGKPPELSLTSCDLEINPAAQIDWSHDVAGNTITTARFENARQHRVRLFGSSGIPKNTVSTIFRENLRVSRHLKLSVQRRLGRHSASSPEP